MKSDGLLDDIKSRLDIVEVISDYVELKKSGQNYKANCPFHSEKTPSFTVSPVKQIFHCFGCGAGGDIVGFIMKYENLNFQETLKMLAKKAGIKLSGYKFESDLSEKKEKLYAIQKEALKLFTEGLKKSKTARSYLDQRGIKDEMVEAFSLGYADREWKSLYEYLKAGGFEDSLIMQSGAVFTGEKGLYDIFRNRLIFPIFNISDDAIAFGGRALDDSMPKYLNTPETILFKKGETLYGLNIAKDEIRKKGYVMITEGYMDVIMCHQHNFINVVAPLGTALTAGHLHKLGRFTKKVLLVFDGDVAGIAAAKRSIALLYEHGFKSKVLLLPEGDDPDSFLRGNGSNAFQTRLSKAKGMVEFIMGLKGERTDNIRTAVEIISSTKDMILREELFKELSEKSGIRESVLRGESNTRYTLNAKRYTLKDSSEFGVRSFSYNEDILLLSSLISSPDRAPYIFKNIDIEKIRTPIVKKIFKEIEPFADNIDMNTMLRVLGDEEKALMTRLSLNPGFDIEYIDKNIWDCLRKIAQYEMEDKIKEAKGSGDLGLLNKLLLEKQRLMKGER
jgi:DNA primase